MAVIIRTYRKTDRVMVIDLWKKVFNNPDFHNDPALAIDMKTKNNDDLFFVAADDSLIVGTVLAGFDGHRGWIYSLAVRSDHRKRGIGSDLMKRALSELKDLGCLKVNLQVEGDNADVVSFYEKVGFIVEDRISMGIRLY